MSSDDTERTSKPRVKRPLSPERKAEVAEAPYAQGFGKPPKGSQFQKGASGNPTGRPKQARAIRTDLLDVLDVQVQVQLPDGPKAMSMQRAMVLGTAAKAAKGDVRAVLAMIKLMELATPERLRDPSEGVALDPAEQAQLEQLLVAMGLPKLSVPVADADDADFSAFMNPDDEGGDDKPPTTP